MKFKIFKFKNVKSTNNSAIRLIKTTSVNSGMIISENQKNGRGQYGKKWISLKGNLFVSFFYKLDNLSVSLKQLTKNLTREELISWVAFFQLKHEEEERYKEQVQKKQAIKPRRR